jgi:hypothetical protein
MKKGNGQYVSHALSKYSILTGFVSTEITWCFDIITKHACMHVLSCYVINVTAITQR